MAAHAATLDDLIRQGLQTYPSVLASQSGRDAAQSELTAARLRFFPSLSLTAQAGRVENEGGQGGGRSPSTQIVLSQPLLLDGGIRAGYDKAGARLGAADYAVREARGDISRRIISAYAEWLKAWLKIQALEDGLRLHEEFAGMIGRRMAQGVASGADRDLGLSRLLQVRADLDMQRAQERTALATLSGLVGQPIERQHLVGDVAGPVAIPPRDDGMARAQSQSAAIQRYRYEAESAEAEAKEIRAQALPQVAVQVQRQIGGATFPGAPSQSGVGLVVSYAPGGGFSAIAVTQAALERAQSARFQIDTAWRELTERLNADYNDHEFALLRKENLQRSAVLAGELAASYDRQYLVGRKSWLDLMNAVREQVQIKLQLADAEASLVGASRRLLVQIDGTVAIEQPRRAGPHLP